jgi:hypothetical protein
VGAKDERKNPKFSTASDEVRAVADCCVAVKVEAVLGKGYRVPLAFGDKVYPLFVNLV